MAQQTPADLIRSRYSSRTWMKLIVLFAIYYFVAAVFIPALRDGGLSWERVEGLIDNLATEIIGAAVTFFIFELVLERRDQERDMLRALRQLKSKVNDTALSAFDELRETDFLYDGSLKHAELTGANLKDANFWEANLEGVKLVGAHLEDADFWDANLEDADLSYAFLQGSSFWEANLKGSDLREANLHGVNLSDANLEGATFEGKHGNNIIRAILDETTTLPDGSKYDPNNGLAQLEQFINLEHPDFWHPKRSEFGHYPWWYKPDEEDNT